MAKPRTARSNRERGNRYHENKIHCPVGKVGWADRRQARAEMRKLMGLNVAEGNAHPMNTYWCDAVGGHWHVGHTPASAAYPNLNDPRLRFVE
jgi:hypothetical protein